MKITIVFLCYVPNFDSKLFKSTSFYITSIAKVIKMNKLEKMFCPKCGVGPFEAKFDVILDCRCGALMILQKRKIEDSYDIRLEIGKPRKKA